MWSSLSWKFSVDVVQISGSRMSFDFWDLTESPFGVMVSITDYGSGISSSNLFIRKPFFGGLVLHQFPKNQENSSFLKSLYRSSHELPSRPYGLGVGALVATPLAWVRIHPVTSFYQSRLQLTTFQRQIMSFLIQFADVKTDQASFFRRFRIWHQIITIFS